MDVFTRRDGGSEFDNQEWFKNAGRFEQEIGARGCIARIGAWLLAESV
jgi:hypothetical protein